MDPELDDFNNSAVYLCVNWLMRVSLYGSLLCFNWLMVSFPSFSTTALQLCFLPKKTWTVT